MPNPVYGSPHLPLLLTRAMHLPIPTLNSCAGMYNNTTPLFRTAGTETDIFPAASVEDAIVTWDCMALRCSSRGKPSTSVQGLGRSPERRVTRRTARSLQESILWIKVVYYMQYTLRKKWVYQLLNIEYTGDRPTPDTMLPVQSITPRNSQLIPPPASSYTVPLKHTHCPSTSSSPVPPTYLPQTGAGKS